MVYIREFDAFLPEKTAHIFFKAGIIVGRKQATGDTRLVADHDEREFQFLRASERLENAIDDLEVLRTIDITMIYIQYAIAIKK